MTTKRCCDCKQVLPVAKFHLRSDRGTPLSVCKACQRIRWRVAQGRCRDEETEQPDRSYIPPTDFLSMGAPDERRALVWRIAA